jgi:hypothetical protein
MSPLDSEEPEAIMKFVRLDETHELGLVEDRVFIIRILPLFLVSVLKFVGRCLQQRKTGNSANRVSWKNISLTSFGKG